MGNTDSAKKEERGIAEIDRNLDHHSFGARRSDLRGLLRLLSKRKRGRARSRQEKGKGPAHFLQDFVSIQGKEKRKEMIIVSISEKREGEKMSAWMKRFVEKRKETSSCRAGDT